MKHMPNEKIKKCMDFCIVFLLTGYFLPQSPFDAFIAGKGNDVPLIIGKERINRFYNLWFTD